MKKLALTLLLLCAAGTSFASDKETLQEACIALKTPAKRSACLDALGRVTSLAPVVTAPPGPAKPLTLSTRGLECEKFEFSEIDSMSAGELEALFCSYSAGSKMSETATNKTMEKYSDPRAQASILQEHIKTLDRCISGMAKVRELANRKYSLAKMDCDKFAVNTAGK